MFGRNASMFLGMLTYVYNYSTECRWELVTDGLCVKDNNIDAKRQAAQLWLRNQQMATF